MSVQKRVHDHRSLSEFLSKNKTVRPTGEETSANAYITDAQSSFRQIKPKINQLKAARIL
uniref:Uncharacterized protein n=1 Tax=Anguilla anguilla TaxID=7936 RepID=A0A0E9XJ52_ANGAN